MSGINFDYKFIKCNKLDVFMNSIVGEFDFRGSSGNLFYKCNYKNVDYFIKLCFYRMTTLEYSGCVSGNNKQITDTEILILQELEQNILSNNYTDGVIKLYHVTTCNDITVGMPEDCDYTQYDGIKKSLLSILCMYANSVRRGFAYDKISFMHIEQCHTTLHNYISKEFDTSLDFKIFKSILFHIIYTLYCINTLYPGFVHNDLHCDNILIKIDDQFDFDVSNIQYCQYNILNNKYYVPYYGITPKIIDFGLSSMPSKNITSIINDDKKMKSNYNNDLLFLLHNINYYIVTDSKSHQLDNMINLFDKLNPDKVYQHFYIADVLKTNNSDSINYAMNCDIWGEYKVEAMNKHIFKNYNDPNNEKK